MNILIIFPSLLISRLKQNQIKKLRGQVLFEIEVNSTLKWEFLGI